MTLPPGAWHAIEAFIVLNALLLLGVTVVPFPTALVAEYLYRHGQQAAAAVYSGTFTVIAIFFNLLWRYASHGHRLLGPAADGERVRAITWAYSYGPPVYLASFALAFVNGAASLALNAALAAFFALPARRRTKA